MEFGYIFPGKGRMVDDEGSERFRARSEHLNALD